LLTMAPLLTLTRGKHSSKCSITNNLLSFRMQLEMALCQLRSTVEADEVLFWGKITGLNADYYIALAVTFKGTYEFPNKQFFWTLSSTADLKFEEMPALGSPMPEQDAFIDSCKSYFEGNPKKPLNKKEGEEEEEAPVPD